MRKMPKKSLIAILASLLLLGNPPVYSAPTEDSLPDIGTTASSTLSVNQEMAMGDLSIRFIRAQSPLIYDPLLTEYINKLGQRLVNHADSVKTPFHFYLVDSPSINAYATFGGNVVLHSALFRYSSTESELASVMAHEISHVTQRHLARFFEDQQRKTPFAWAGALGSVLLMMASPQAGMAALSGTLAGIKQNIISFTQSNEQEADRIGLRILSRAGFDPQAMPMFMQNLADQSRYSSKLPEILYTHPLPDNRLSDARNRANQYPAKIVPESQDFLFASIRILTMYSAEQNSYTEQLLKKYSQGTAKEQLAATYGRALLLSMDKKYAEAKTVLSPLLDKYPDNVWFIDAMTDIDIGQKQYTSAIARLQNALKKQKNNPVLQINLANAYLQAKQYSQASQLLFRYTFNNPNDLNGWTLLTEVAGKQGKPNEELAAYAETMALQGKFDIAIAYLSRASAMVKLGSHDQERYDARIDQLRQLQHNYEQYYK
ncbi:TPR repeat-containing protein [Xenorhabdus mauleonii]|uniref:Beta-barrel assembly-enhancing protease n=1 Tax=Xenorhabdus mauleonii TaxID=351675 RepID=A0A1I3N1P2_9GAMM|nr:M48 family metallopeptidase [Xenorhabdus mauleonii]PHM45810.1 TPR repeat-containing protein [Xenorhabdus mauleonii]SFJ03111.1 Putative Zn-dependent protease, contains TPR repeats [Xenorhabdus mauleonii]